MTTEIEKKEWVAPVVVDYDIEETTLTGFTNVGIDNMYYS